MQLCLDDLKDEVLIFNGTLIPDFLPIARGDTVEPGRQHATENSDGDLQVWLLYEEHDRRRECHCHQRYRGELRSPGDAAVLPPFADQRAERAGVQ